MKGKTKKAPKRTARQLVPPDLRYQFLKAGPGRSSARVWGIALTVGGVAGFATWALTGSKVGLVISTPVALLVSAILKKLSRFLPKSKDYRAVPIGVSPWGLLVDPDGTPLAVPWGDVRDI